jgi:hypothetical protein
MNRFAAVIAAGALVLMFGVAVTLSASPSSAPPPATSGPDLVPTEEDMVRIAAEEFALLPESAYQVDCSPSFKRLPPFTALAISGKGFIILADGRCFTDPDAPKMAAPELIAPPSGSESSDAP